ncbi:hypothetical protein F5B19DRAFT_450054 [Rostrohypoxylon terebratum]|nr:hypothetical protein F5B19DRAFT_450054 [Rostrohypoxylon terebratum]
MSKRSDFSAMVSDSGRKPQTTCSSYSLEEYLRKPPASAIERVVGSQKPMTPTDREKKVKAELESWSAGFDRAGQSSTSVKGETHEYHRR